MAPHPSALSRWFQLIAAPHSANFSAGVFYCRVLRGRSFSCRAIALSLAGKCTKRSVPRGKYCHSGRLVFSFEPRGQGECGSQKMWGTEVDIDIGCQRQALVICQVLTQTDACIRCEWRSQVRDFCLSVKKIRRWYFMAYAPSLFKD